MINKIRSNSAFTLVEIMIVVAIIALLATIAVPSFLRARKRSQATKVVNDARILEDAIDQYAIETGASGKTDPKTKYAEVAEYIKDGHRMRIQMKAGSDPTDVLNNQYELSIVDNGVKVNADTYDEFLPVTKADNDGIPGPDFWAGWYP